ncbi:MAG: alpha-ketoglutarate-dependent dioxygenase AlkB [Flavobacterium sp.]|nr:MAG: alpha-ketoglutarate-dependent dioxygenase AlkB [Flavobacterium sp.]
MELFNSEDHLSTNLHLKDADVRYYPSLISSELATSYFDKLYEDTIWQQDEIKLFGKVYPQPRLTALYADNRRPYSYSGIIMHPLPFSPLLHEIKRKVEIISEIKFTTVLLNLYRDGNDSNGWHSDDEKELGQDPVIASVSLGAKRRFQLRHKKDKSLRTTIELEHGSLLLMKGPTQNNWQHQLPKSKRIMEPRINLTFRIIAS